MFLSSSSSSVFYNRNHLIWQRPLKDVAATEKNEKKKEEEEEVSPEEVEGTDSVIFTARRRRKFSLFYCHWPQKLR